MNKVLVVSFSGGETSAYMTKWLLENKQDSYEKIVVIFANTGEENEETLEFVRDCDKHFGFSTVWVEAVVNPVMGEAITHKIVDFDTAARNGEPFEAVIAKYGIPNQAFRHCTYNLKRYPIEAYMRSLGLRPKEYDLAIGIRADEIDRMAIGKGRNLVYPLISMHPMKKPQIVEWWSQQAFRLRLADYQGNCKWCWKKSMRKHFRIIKENPSAYDFPRRMEMEYGRVGAEFKKDPPPEPEYFRTFFRKHLTTDDLFQMAADYVEPAQQLSIFDDWLDVGAGCEESCEVFSSEEDLVSAEAGDEPSL